MGLGDGPPPPQSFTFINNKYRLYFRERFIQYNIQTYDCISFDWCRKK